MHHWRFLNDTLPEATRAAQDFGRWGADTEMMLLERSDEPWSLKGLGREGKTEMDYRECADTFLEYEITIQAKPLVLSSNPRKLISAYQTK